MIDAAPSKAPEATGSVKTLVARLFVAGAVVLLLAFGVVTVASMIAERSPLAQVTERLIRTGKVIEQGFAWQSEWSLMAMEAAPWGPRGGTVASEIDPYNGTMVINLWATWCEPCRAELPDMFKLARRYKERNVDFIFVSYDEDWEVQSELFKQLLGAMPRDVVLLRDPKAEAGGDQANDSMWSQLGATGIPETFFIKDGRVLTKVVGAINWDHPDVQKYLDLLVTR